MKKKGLKYTYAIKKIDIQKNDKNIGRSISTK